MRERKPIEAYTKSQCSDLGRYCYEPEVRKLESDYEERDQDARRFIDQIVKLKQEKYNYKHWYKQQKYNCAELETKLSILTDTAKEVAEETGNRELSIVLEQIRVEPKREIGHRGTEVEYINNDSTSELETIFEEMIIDGRACNTCNGYETCKLSTACTEKIYREALQKHKNKIEILTADKRTECSNTEKR